MNRRTLLRRIGTAGTLTTAATATTGVATAEMERVEIASLDDVPAGVVDHHRIVAVDGDDYFVPAGLDPATHEFRDVSSSTIECCSGVTGCSSLCDGCYICPAL